MELPTAGGIVTVFGNQEEARRCEDNASTANKNVHVIETPNEDNEASSSEEPQKSGGVSPAEHTKKVPLCKDVSDRMVIIGKGQVEDSHEAIRDKAIILHIRLCEEEKARGEERAEEIAKQREVAFETMARR